MQELVSVLIPCYNCENYIEISILSICNQTYKNLEIIVIDDCSTDNSYSILKKLSFKDSRIRIYRNEINQKLIYTLNRGLELCNGKYIARMDADDISHPERIEKQVSAIIDYNVDIIASQIWFINSDSIIIRKSNFLNSSTVLSLYISFFEVPFVHPSVLLKASVLKKYKYLTNEKNLHIEDLELWHRLLKNGFTARILQDRLLYYRINNEGVTRKFASIQLENRTQFIINAIEEFIGLNFDRKVVPYLSRQVLLGNGNIRLKEVVSELKSFESQFIAKYIRDVNSTDDLVEIANWTNFFIAKYILHILVNAKFNCKISSLFTFIKNPKLMLDITKSIIYNCFPLTINGKIMFKKKII